MMDLWQAVIEFEEQCSAQHTVIDLAFYSSVEDLIEVGPEKLEERVP